MFDFPEIEGVEWLSKISPDLIKIPVTFVDAEQHKLGLEEVEEMPGFVHLDLSKLALVEPFFEKGHDDISTRKCRIGVGGADMLVNISMDNMLKLWVFNKDWYLLK